MKGDAEKALRKLASQMIQKSLSAFLSTSSGLAVGRDGKGLFPGISSDGIHSLYYLDANDIPGKAIAVLNGTAKYLETSIGYVGSSIKPAQVSSYHTENAWPFENAFIHLGARKHGLAHIEEVSFRVFQAVTSISTGYPELVYLSKDETDDTVHVKERGCHTQLWTIGAMAYFSLFEQGNTSTATVAK